MQLQGSRVITHGIIGGLAAGAVVAVWFLVVDLSSGQAFATPAALAATLLGAEFVSATPGAILAFTFVHFTVFAVLGAATGFAMSALGLEPKLRYGAVFGIGVLNAVHYGALVVVNAEIGAVLPGVHVVLANLCGGMALMTYLHHASQAEAPLGLGFLRHHRLLVQGIGVGFIGAAAVALWFLLLDVATGRALFTPGALGSLVFLGASSAAEVRVSLGMVAAYSALHLAVFAAVGVGLSWVASRIEHTPGLWLLALMTFILIEAASVGVLGLLGSWVLGSLGWLAVVAGNIVAVSSMAWMIWRLNPALRDQLGDQAVPTMV